MPMAITVAPMTAAATGGKGDISIWQLICFSLTNKVLLLSCTYFVLHFDVCVRIIKLGITAVYRKWKENWAFEHNSYMIHFAV